MIFAQGFVTVSLALGKTEAWITDRTGPCSTQMIYAYERAARTYAELGLGGVKPMWEAIPEIAAERSPRRRAAHSELPQWSRDGPPTLSQRHRGAARLALGGGRG